jgi:hypothetical protein
MIVASAGYCEAEESAPLVWRFTMSCVPLQQRGRSLTRAASATGQEGGREQAGGNCSGQQRTCGIRDGISRGRESGRSDAFGEGR